MKLGIRYALAAKRGTGWYDPQTRHGIGFGRLVIRTTGRPDLDPNDEDFYFEIEPTIR